MRRLRRSTHLQTILLQCISAHCEILTQISHDNLTRNFLHFFNAKKRDVNLDYNPLSSENDNVTTQSNTQSKATNTARQRRYRQKMKGLDLSLVQVWVPPECVLELRAVAARMKAKGSEKNEPTRLQLDLAQLICVRKGLSLKPEHLSSRRKLSRWIRQSSKMPNKLQTW
jgi:hypothetical protein